MLDLISKLFVEKFPTKRLLCLYIQPEHPFDEIEEFIADCERHYKIEVKAIRGTVKGALGEICKQNPQLKACAMGCRRTDPYCENLKEFQVRSHMPAYAPHNATSNLFEFPFLSVKGNGSRLATIAASESVVRLDVQRYLEIFARVQCTLLFVI